MSTIIRIIGGSGSGKSTVARNLTNNVKNISTIPVDNYYLPNSKQVKDARGVYNYDLPEAIDIKKFVHDLQILQSGKSITIREYTFEDRKRTPKEIIIEPNDLILIEGLFLLHIQEIRDLDGYTIFVKASDEVCLQRRLKRDVLERGDTEEIIKYRWTHHIQPSYKTYIEPYIEEVDLVVDGNGTSNNAYIQALVGLVNRYNTLVMNT